MHPSRQRQDDNPFLDPAPGPDSNPFLDPAIEPSDLALSPPPPAHTNHKASSSAAAAAGVNAVEDHDVEAGGRRARGEAPVQSPSSFLIHASLLGATTAILIVCLIAVVVVSRS